MVILNNTNDTIMVDSQKVIVDEHCDFTENCFDTHYVITKRGGVVITTEYSNRHFDILGEVECVEIEEKDNQGLKVIKIS